jgi:hypothetical protein
MRTERPRWALRFFMRLFKRGQLVDVEIQPLGHGVEKPAGANLVEILIEVNAKRALFPLVVLVLFGRVNDAAVEGLAAHQFLNELVARVER